MLIENKHIGYSCQKESFFLHNRAKIISHCGTNKQTKGENNIHGNDTKLSALNNINKLRYFKMNNASESS